MALRPRLWPGVLCAKWTAVTRHHGKVRDRDRQAHATGANREVLPRAMPSRFTMHVFLSCLAGSEHFSRHED